jgi:hypothetical protein
LQVLNTVLDDKHLVLVAKTDLSEILSSSNRPIDGITTAFKSPFTGTLPDDIGPMSNFTAAARSRDDISSKAFIILDSQTVKDGGRTCQVTTYDDDSDEDNYQDRVPFRCELSSAVAALQAIERSQSGEEPKTARAFRNEAAIAGGVWSQESAARQHSKTSHFNPADYPQNKAWDTNSGPRAPEDALPYLPVFCTTEISLEVPTQNSFVSFSPC